jgi:hypothetical protein
MRDPMALAPPADLSDEVSRLEIAEYAAAFLRTLLLLSRYLSGSSHAALLRSSHSYLHNDLT